MKKTDIVFCAVTNSVLYAVDALYGADGKAYRPECAPKGAMVGVFDADDEPAGEAEPTDLITVAVDVTTADEAGDTDADATDTDDEPAGEDYPNARHNGRRHNRHGDR